MRAARRGSGPVGPATRALAARGDASSRSSSRSRGGKRDNRPELAKALAAYRVHGATLIIVKLDRLVRNVAFISNLMASGVEFVAVDFPQAGQLTVHILVAEEGTNPAAPQEPRRCPPD
jgi:hypothetical protein